MHRLGMIAILGLATAGAMAQDRQFLNPPELSKPAGYTHVVVAPAGRTIYLSGQVALDKEGKLVGKGDFPAQAGQVFTNIDAALKAAHASFADVVKLTFYVTDATQAPALRVVRDKYVDTAHPPPARWSKCAGWCVRIFSSRSMRPRLSPTRHRRRWKRGHLTAYPVASSNRMRRSIRVTAISISSAAAKRSPAGAS